MLEIIIKERGKARAIVPILQMRKVRMKVPSEYQSQKTSETRPSYSTSRFTIPESWPQALPTLPADSARCSTLKPGQAARWRLGSCSNFWPLAQLGQGPGRPQDPHMPAGFPRAHGAGDLHRAGQTLELAPCSLSF